MYSTISFYVCDHGWKCQRSSYPDGLSEVAEGVLAGHRHGIHRLGLTLLPVVSLVVQRRSSFKDLLCNIFAPPLELIAHPAKYAELADYQYYLCPTLREAPSPHRFYETRALRPFFYKERSIPGQGRPASGTTKGVGCGAALARNQRSSGHQLDAKEKEMLAFALQNAGRQTCAFFHQPMAGYLVWEETIIKLPDLYAECHKLPPSNIGRDHDNDSVAAEIDVQTTSSYQSSDRDKGLDNVTPFTVIRPLPRLILLLPRRYPRNHCENWIPSATRTYVGIAMRCSKGVFDEVVGEEISNVVEWLKQNVQVYHPMQHETQLTSLEPRLRNQVVHWGWREEHPLLQASQNCKPFHKQSRARKSYRFRSNLNELQATTSRVSLPEEEWGESDYQHYLPLSPTLQQDLQLFIVETMQLVNLRPARRSDQIDVVIRQLNKNFNTLWVPAHANLIRQQQGQ
ncbi:hypothetical protein DFJ77DRAFT_541694 [Powellomyces hirtus]|nr:hypothetical protein DFJ77DRAFT_541694 [Powellomyces hirtus]